VSDGPDVRRCRSCDAKILWAQTPAGKPIPLDALPRPDGNLVLVRREGKSVAVGARDADYSRFVGEGAPLRVAHFVTCPNADAHRKTNRQQDLF
jgi:hypothetical protein